MAEKLKNTEWCTVFNKKKKGTVDSTRDPYGLWLAGESFFSFGKNIICRVASEEMPP